ncbi:DUF4190 domain-containing protein [Streptomyces sp. NPDC059534]|uniref:DUF4190 domain-containing protein n=1 Tax=Streptomyces sp. NPDC059534 TaxID=3346859 RepID=UPI00368F969F
MEPIQPTPPPPFPEGGPQQPGWPAPGPYTSPGMPYTPYGPPGMPGVGPYGPPRRTTNGLAVGSLVSGVVCCLPPLGLVLGLMALPQIRKRDQAGKGLAIAGIALSALSCLLLVVGLVTGGIGSAWQGFKENVDEASRTKSPSSLRTGDCFGDKDKAKEYATHVEVVDCAGPHDGEVTGRFKVTGFDTWPGEDAVDALAEKRCDTINSTYALDTWAVPTDVWTYYYLPSKESWRLGDRSVICAYASEGEPFKGSVRSDTSTLTLDQAYFLKAVNPIEAAVYEEPDEDPDEDFAANKAWAGKVVAAIDGARAGLKAQSWPGASTAPVAGLGTTLDAASKEFGKLARAADAEAYWDAYDTAWDALPENLGAEARTALGLTDTLPAKEGTSA